MTHHLAVLKKPYLDAILVGTKRIEIRLARVKMPLYGVIETGDVIWLKVTSAPIVARAVAGAVDFFDNLTPEAIDQLSARYRSQTLGSDAFWTSRRHCRYATLIHLADVTPIAPFFPAFANYSPWRVLNGPPAVDYS